MKPMIAMRSLAALAFVLSAAVPVRAQEPSTEFTGWLCEIDLSGINRPPGVPASVFTFDSTKHCPGNIQGGQSESITIECLASIPQWTGPASTNQNVPCRINGDQCGVPGFVSTTDSSLNINSAGNARLFCKHNPP
jgi:hypothetical protein